MDLVALIIEYGGWSWVIGGFVLLAIELVVPGGIFVWFGLAAVLVGLATLTQALNWQMQWILFAVLSVSCVAVWTLYFKGRKDVSDRPFLNARNEKLIGQVFSLDEPIVDGIGSLKVGDSFWRVTGPELAKGTKVKVTSVEATMLHVEAV
ncbi:NfeD family protein [Maritalea porphyrae]|mgnify:CR=1 FL=1|jgi:membrane protein implicated in regulation of membrane protease activity|uniref:NfeD family protein n=1 Tax=Maritalea porphyrae TaxID=880732 RepID=UPI0022AF2E23|nr:NfeD family protein [Maritalea porphyrae]MCZ4273784.1 NfeD family protein [Maritalea porphyrae]